MSSPIPVRPFAPDSAPPGPAAPAEPSLVPAVERAARIVDHLAGQRRPQPLADLAKALALPKSSLHGLLHTLAALGLASRNERGEYALGSKPLQWAAAFVQQSGVIEAFNAAADRLATLHEETIMLAVLDGADVLYLACRPGTRALGVTFRVGGRFPASCTSSGKAMLATLSEARVRRLLGDGPLPTLTPHSLPDVAALLSQLETFRASGYALDDEETAEGMHCFGAPVFAAGQPEAVAAVAVSLIKASTSPERYAEVVTAVRALAAAVSQQLGGRPAPDAAQ
ncbi:MAG: IclR family transcriptional regulator [Burkholderiaceae bacterium]